MIKNLRFFILSYFLAHPRISCLLLLLQLFLQPCLCRFFGSCLDATSPPNPFQNLIITMMVILRTAGTFCLPSNSTSCMFLSNAPDAGIDQHASSNAGPEICCRLNPRLPSLGWKNCSKMVKLWWSPWVSKQAIGKKLEFRYQIFGKRQLIAMFEKGNWKH